MARLLIVDGHAYAYRAFYAIRGMTSPTGKPTNAVYGFIKMLAKLRASLQPSHVVVVWDGGLSAERTTALPGYKAQRPEMPDELGSQIQELVEYLAAAGLASLCRDGVEADDVIAGLARRAAVAGWDVVVASSDKDFMQLVTPRIGLVNPSDKSVKVWGAAEVRAKAGVDPQQVVDWLALVGDAVDNIPGVTGVGPKTAAGLLNQFGSVTQLYGQLDAVKSERLRGALVAATEIVRRNVELVRLKEELASDVSLADLAVRPERLETLREQYSRWGFRSMLAELVTAQVAQPVLL